MAALRVRVNVAGVAVRGGAPPILTSVPMVQNVLGANWLLWVMVRHVVLRTISEIWTSSITPFHFCVVSLSSPAIRMFVVVVVRLPLAVAVPSDTLLTAPTRPVAELYMSSR
jgi:hypothetical protein